MVSVNRAQVDSQENHIFMALKRKNSNSTKY
jgi:hypothetical protein